jgi:3-phosphoshikimate 1-carboxyvinyltransferase
MILALAMCSATNAPKAISEMHYPPQLEIHPLTAAPRTTVRVPGSKSITNRALVLAALCGTPCTLRGVLQSEDTDVMVQGLQTLGFAIEANWADEWIRIENASTRRIPAANADLFVANSGTTMRFLTAMLALGQGRYRLDGVARMRERPIQDLLAALGQLGVRAYSEAQNGCPPVILEANGLHGGTVTIKGDVSSQFLSGLLMAAPFADFLPSPSGRGAGGEGSAAVTIEVEGTLVSIPYVEMTLAMMRQFHLSAECDNHRRYRIPGNQAGGLCEYDIEPDASAASYFFGAAAITGGTITVEGMPTGSMQGDVRFVEVLAQMGCTIERSDDAITVHGAALRGIDVDMNDISDTVMTLGAVACFADGPTTIRNVAHIRHKETDRVSALATELRRIGAAVHECRDGMTIVPAPLHGAVIQTYHDHRMAMSLALVGLKIPGIVIDHPACVAKTYPRFFDDLKQLGVCPTN